MGRSQIHARGLSILEEGEKGKKKWGDRCGTGKKKKKAKQGETRNGSQKRGRKKQRACKNKESGRNKNFF